MYELLPENLDYLVKDGLFLSKFYDMMKVGNSEFLCLVLYLLHDKHNNVFGSILQLLMQRSSECDVIDMSIVTWIAKMFVLPSNFLDGFIVGWWKGTEKFKEANNSDHKKVRLICKFILNLVEKKVIDVKQPQDHWFEYLKKFMNGMNPPNEDALKLYTKINGSRDPPLSNEAH